MDHKIGGNSENTEISLTYEVDYADSLGSEMYRRQEKYGVCESKRASNATTDVLTEPVNEGASISPCCA